MVYRPLFKQLIVTIANTEKKHPLPLVDFNFAFLRSQQITKTPKRVKTRTPAANPTPNMAELLRPVCGETLSSVERKRQISRHYDRLLHYLYDKVEQDG